MKLNVILLAIALVLSGCSVAIIHPPSASAFMEKGDGDLQKNVTASYVWGTNGNDHLESYETIKRKPLPDEEHGYDNTEWWFQSTFDMQKQYGNFKLGFGLDWTSPYVQAGFISDYFGAMGWSNLCFYNFKKYEYAYIQWAGGFSIIEQLPFYSGKLRVGLTQHISRNGREALEREDFTFNVHSVPVLYDEIGTGAYVAGIVGKRLGMGLEFRYGRDLTYKIVEKERERAIHRFTLTLNVQWW